MQPRTRRGPELTEHPLVWRRSLFGATCVALAASIASCSPSPEPVHHTPEIERLAAHDNADVGARNALVGPGVAHAPTGVDSAPAPQHPAETRRDASEPIARAVLTPSNADTARSNDEAPPLAQFSGKAASSDVHRVADWVVATSDNQGLPFIIVDKKEAKVYVFGAAGHLQDTSPALLGLARGDDSVPGIGERPMASIRPAERTTPAGRFVAELGVNSEGEDILWVDYADAISMHRVRATNPVERRLQRLASTTASDNRISYGCINLPAAFYELSVKPTFAGHGGIVYVLPETRPLHATFPGVKPAELAMASASSNAWRRTVAGKRPAQAGTEK